MTVGERQMGKRKFQGASLLQVGVQLVLEAMAALVHLYLDCRVLKGNIHILVIPYLYFCMCIPRLSSFHCIDSGDIRNRMM